MRDRLKLIRTITGQLNVQKELQADRIASMMKMVKSMTPLSMRIIIPRNESILKPALSIHQVTEPDGNWWSGCSFRYQCKCGAKHKVVDTPVSADKDKSWCEVVCNKCKRKHFIYLSGNGHWRMIAS